MTSAAEVLGSMVLLHGGFVLCHLRQGRAGVQRAGYVA